MPDQQDTLSLPPTGTSVTDRIRYLISATRNNQSSFAKAIGVDSATVSRILGSDRKPSDSFLNRIVVNLGVSKKWLTDGSDVPFPRNPRPEDSRPQGAPVYDIDVTAGATPLSRMFTEERIMGRVFLPGIDPSLPIVRVSGDSMMPKLKPGCYVSIRPISLDAPISWGRIYVVVLPDYRFIKYVRPNADPAMVTLVSANPAYDDIEVPRADIEGLYLVENVLNHDSPA